MICKAYATFISGFDKKVHDFIQSLDKLEQLEKQKISKRAQESVTGLLKLLADMALVSFYI